MIEYGFWGELKKPFFVLAPMEDVTDVVFRQLVARSGRPDVFFTEFTSADGLFSPGRDGVIHRLEKAEDEFPLVAQIWGNSPENYLQAGGLLREMGFDGIDINMGCPVPKIVKNGCCSALIENHSLSRELIQAAKEGAGGLPVSVKTRIGFRKPATEKWISFLLDQDVAAITVHGRTAKQMSKVPADWNTIKEAVEIRDSSGKGTLVIGNGDILSIDKAKERVAETGVDGVMVGRGIFQNLFLFDPTQTPLQDRDVEEKLKLFLEHVTSFESYWQGRRPLSMLKKFFRNYVNGFSGASDLRTALMDANTAEEVRKIVQEWPGSNCSFDVEFLDKINV